MPPPEFSRPPRPPTDVRACIDAALQRRAALLCDPSCTAIRLFNSAADGIDGFVVEQLADVLVAQLHEGRLCVAEAELRRACERLMQQRGAAAVYRKTFPRDRSHAGPQLDALHTSSAPWLGNAAAPEIEIRENGIRFLVRPYDGYSTGLFLEHRANRAQVRALAAGRRVLNTFAYTCGFSVAAALGGAARTVSVDVSKKYLEWGKANFAANGIALEDHWFIRSDVLEYYRRAKRQEQRFDFIILDPPTFGREKGGRAFSFVDHARELVRGALELLEPGGIVLLATNHRATRPADLSRLVHTAAADVAQRAVRAEILARPELPLDFAGDPDYAKVVIARFS